MKEIRWVDNHIEIDPPKRTKKITGTRFATILGKMYGRHLFRCGVLSLKPMKNLLRVQFTPRQVKQSNLSRLSTCVRHMV